MTAINATGSGNLTLYPANLSVPLATHDLLRCPGRRRASNAIVRLSTDGEGRIGVTAALGVTGQVDVILDVVGYFE